ncbi:hypothetical protein BN80_048 [Yersinia phage phiR1-RT]|uniref:Chorismate mutase domain-containing protein n=2 Tax=Tegunavirus TaxID=1921704 RepID=A0A0B4ZX19_9CAUD|nr:hypothetical protein BN80_048 [Yersinia phage phiR1-RT]YP_009200311.1 hypothetical protein AVV33_gp050 [Yersinia phage vB_YenM_TG1]AJD81857.1 hypothetical protein YenMTG1_050 [Yersinia phage vB_YenM_TG1]CCI88622.1 hypothetical protein BN80_048 [Yersinia phage phiR1-RT]
MNYLTRQMKILGKGTYLQLENLRSDVSNIDNEIKQLLDSRFKITNRIGYLKKENGLQIENIELEKAKLALIPIELQCIFGLIFEESKRQQRISNDKL